MGIFGRIKDPVQGTARVVGCSAPLRGVHQDCVMQLVVTVEGQEPYAVEHTQMVKVTRWPRPGMTLPVTVSRKDPNKVKVDFAEVPDWQDTAMDRAEQVAASMKGEGAAPAAAPASGAGAPGDRIAQLERLAELRKSGALTEAEFAAEKAKLLGT